MRQVIAASEHVDRIAEDAKALASGINDAKESEGRSILFSRLSGLAKEAKREEMNARKTAEALKRRWLLLLVDEDAF